ncbi:MAG: zinc D-Ala-D-Ala dipeptidase [Verrucomicrobiota bacterium]|jgi:D-alanyl-D-alanine dipeptidase
MRLPQSAVLIVAGFLTVAQTALAQNKVPLIDIKSVDPTIVVKLRYDGTNNIVGHRLYNRGMPAFIRPELAPRLRSAQKFLRNYDYRLMIWDAYRPPSAQKELWRTVHNNQFVADPEAGAGSMHTWGVAVDCTLADLHNRAVAMPTDFDDFTPAAMSRYAGFDPAIRTHLRLLQVAMAAAGFYGFRSEWWHFTAKDWTKYLPPAEAKRVVETFGNAFEENL